MRYGKMGGLALGLVAIAAAWVLGASVEYPVTVTSLGVEGNAKIGESDILHVVSFETGDAITADDLRAASTAIHDLGWFSEVVPNVDPSGSIVFRVVENPVVRELEITGNINTEPFELFGIRLFDYDIVSTDLIRRTLRDHDVRLNRVLNTKDLQTALEAIIQEYSDKGYALIMIGNVIPGETLSIQVIEGRVMEHVIAGLKTVPEEIARDLIDVPVGRPVKTAPIQANLAKFAASIYFDDVQISSMPGAASDEFKLVWNVTERALLEAPVTADGIVFDGITVFEEDRVAELVPPLPDGTVDNYELLAALSDLHDAYYRSGHIMTRYAPGDVVDGRLTVRIEEGRIGQVVVEGNTRTEERIVTKMIDVREGDLLDRSRLAVSYQALMALGYFGSVEVVPEWVDDVVVLTFRITEKNTFGGVNGTLAYSPQSGGIVGTVDLSWKNVQGTGQDVSIAYNRGVVADASVQWNLGYSTVAFFQEFDRVGFDLYRRTDEKTVDDEKVEVATLGGQASVTYPAADYAKLDLSYKREQIRTGDVDVWEELDSVTVALRYDDVANPNFPTQGMRRRLALEQAGGFTVGATFGRIDLSWIGFFPVHVGLPFFEEREQTLAMRLWTRYGIGLPATQRYDLGGVLSVRGTDTSQADRMLVANFEYRLQLIEGLSTSLFFDAGVDLDNLRPENVKSAFGLELAVQAAGVYVRLDMAWELGETFSPVPRFDFGFGPMF